MANQPADDTLLQEARALHRRHPVVDLHADPLLWARMFGYDITRRHEAWMPRAALWSHCDVPRWDEAGVNLALTGVVTLPGRSFYRQAEQIIALSREAAWRCERWRVVDDAASFEAALAGETVGGLLSIEGLHAAQGSQGKLDRLIELGVRSVGLAHFHGNAAVAPSYGVGGDSGPLASRRKASRGLSAHGHEVIAMLNANRVCVDLAHTSRSGFFDAARASTAPVFVSHTGLRSAHDHWRNIDDEQVRAVADSGGIVGIIFAGMYVGASSVERVVDHLARVVELVGDEHAALGSDFDGFIVPVRELPDVAALPHLTTAMLRRGWSEERVARILGGNAVRYLRDVTGWERRRPAGGRPPAGS